MFMLSTDGFSNSYKNEDEFKKTCKEYFEMVNQYGADTVDANLNSWLTETSEQGCGDDITVLMAYFCEEGLEAAQPVPDEPVTEVEGSTVELASKESEVEPDGESE